MKQERGTLTQITGNRKWKTGYKNQDTGTRKHNQDTGSGTGEPGNVNQDTTSLS